jgi:hypothetical protein
VSSYPGDEQYASEASQRTAAALRDAEAGSHARPSEAQARARTRIIERGRKIRAEIAQTFTDVASWNENGRKAGEAPIDPDPDG